MKELFIQNSILNGSLNGNRYVYVAEGAPKAPEQVDKAVEKAKDLPKNPEQPVKETKVEGRKAIRKADLDMDAQVIKPRNAKELAKDKKMEDKVAKLAPFLRDKEFAKMTEITPNEEQMRELATQIHQELPPDLAKQMLARLDRMDAAHANQDDFKIILDKADDIFVNYEVEKDPRQARNLITRLGVDVQRVIAQRDEKLGKSAIASGKEE